MGLRAKGLANDIVVKMAFTFTLAFGNSVRSTLHSV